MRALLALVLLFAFGAQAAESPHADAIRLVMELRADEIAKLDPPDAAWHDTHARTWTAKRPFGPGVLDTTHYFEVTYAIDGKVVATWMVNTRFHQVGGAGESVRIE